MSMQSEWKDRIKQWKDELKKQFYSPIAAIPMSGFVTKEYLSYEMASQRERVAYTAGMKWGSKWEYGWFFGTATVPEEFAGEKLVINMGMGTEGLIYVNGMEFGTYRADWVRYPHQYQCDLVLSECAQTGETYEIAFEAYAGHGERVIQTGPLSLHRKAINDTPKEQATVSTTSIGVWNEEAYQLWLDLSVLVDIRNCLDANSLRVQRIDKALKEFTKIVDFEQEKEKVDASYRAARQMLRPLLECVNGSTAPTMYAFGHSHLDIAWLWTIEETKRKCGRTFSNQLHLMEQYPEYRFIQSQPYLYEQTKQNYPGLYERIKEKVSTGQFMPEGGMWVEAETNMSGGESLIRQFLYGKEFFREEMGVESKMLWLPDVFGYTAALPQIMKGCGIQYFTTQKILNPYNDCELFPYNYFTWRGMDGSEITSFIHEDYTANTNAKSVIKRWDNRRQKEDNEAFIYPFGYGDGGAGPTRDHLEYIRRLENLEGVPKVKMASPTEFFTEMQNQGRLPVPVYCGEIYFQAHRGVYTSQAKTKKGNRQSEFALREAEIWSVLLDRREYVEELKELYKILLLNQFHDILPGSSIAAVYEEAEKNYERLLNRIREMLKEMMDDKDPGDKMTVYNSLPWERTCLVLLPKQWGGAKNENTQSLPIQQTRDGVYARVTVPPMGYSSIANTFEEAKKPSLDISHLENEYLIVRWNEYGELTSIFDKETKRELTQGTCNTFCMYGDTPRIFDAWDIDSMYEECQVELTEKAEIEVLENGLLFQSILVKRNINNSSIVQEIRLQKKSRQVDFITQIDWKESHKLLKVQFPVNIHSDEMLNEIQFGYIKRPNHKSRQYDADRFECCNHKWSALIEGNKGVAILNDCKYGISANHNSLNLTLLKAGKAPDENADIGMQSFTYSFYCWNQTLLESDVVEKGYELNTPVTLAAGWRESKSFLSISKKNVMIETIKFAHDGSGDWIIRVFENKNASVSCQMHLPWKNVNVYETDMLENIQNQVEMQEEVLDFYIKGFEVKTFRVVRRK